MKKASSFSDNFEVSISFDIFKHSGTYTTQEGPVFVRYFVMEIYKIQ